MYSTRTATAEMTSQRRALQRSRSVSMQAPPESRASMNVTITNDLCIVPRYSVPLRASIRPSTRSPIFCSMIGHRYCAPTYALPLCCICRYCSLDSVNSRRISDRLIWILTCTVFPKVSKMQDRIKINSYLDFYESLLTDKQRQICSMYYREDLSLQEIADIEADVMKELGNIVKGARDGNKTLILVTNELGMSMVSSYRLGRIFTDMAGKANQLLASLSEEVYISISGVPLRLK